MGATGETAVPVRFGVRLVQKVSATRVFARAAPHLVPAPDRAVHRPTRGKVPLTGPERDAAWRAVLAFGPPYAAYQSRVTREIRLFRLGRR
ncbi:hypothetical protein [Streptomyces sp. NPDC053560]|uniref:hypothetical protein n=1 Tax=Streptomyces sp. NPDC053560 TaxID=3365711 RepID=UPI0037CE988B